MKFLSREDQLLGSLKRTIASYWFSPQSELNDTLLDGLPIENKPTVKNWIDENKVHQAKFLSFNIASSRMFTGKQEIAVRDEQRLITHICFIEANSLIVCSIKNNEIIKRDILHEGFTQRACICLNKFTGETYTLHCSEYNGKKRLFLNKTEIQTEAMEPDFPFIVLSQPPIGHLATSQPEYGLISYKCRKSGKIFLRKFSVEEMENERVLQTPNTLGGVDFAISNDDVLFRIECIKDNSLIPMTATSSDRGNNITDFEQLDFSSLNPDRLLPTNASVFKDYLGNIHIPILAQKADNSSFLNITPNKEIVEAIRVKGETTYVSDGPFPRKPGRVVNNLGIGNGFTDGLGLIATVQSEGSLFSSNSQAGGHFFPKEVVLNFEMPKTYCFKVTNCYTKGENPNSVSMDYVFIEADDIGDAVSQRLMVETWNMSLPEPVLTADSNVNSVTLRIEQDGFFEKGKTTFSFSNPTIEIDDVNFISDREVVIRTNSNLPDDLEVIFEMKSLLYYH